jgi:hypothetical protein
MFVPLLVPLPIVDFHIRKRTGKTKSGTKSKWWSPVLSHVRGKKAQKSEWVSERVLE